MQVLVEGFQEEGRSNVTNELRTFTKVEGHEAVRIGGDQSGRAPRSTQKTWTN